MVATAVIFSSALPAMFGTFVKHRFQNTYDAILAAPVDVEELVTAEMLWIALRSGTYGCVPLLVTIAFGLDPAWGMLLVPFFCFTTALGFAGFGIAMAATVAKIDQFNYVTALFVTPLFLVAGTFFPIEGLPQGFQAIAQVNPLHQLVELVRGGAFGFEAVDLARFAFLVGFALLTWRIAVITACALAPSAVSGCVPFCSSDAGIGPLDSVSVSVTIYSTTPPPSGSSKLDAGVKCARSATACWRNRVAARLTGSWPPAPRMPPPLLK